MLYGKATEVALSDVDTASSLTLMSADIERIVTGMETGHEVRQNISPSSSRWNLRRLCVIVRHGSGIASRSVCCV